MLSPKTALKTTPARRGGTWSAFQEKSTQLRQTPKTIKIPTKPLKPNRYPSVMPF